MSQQNFIRSQLTSLSISSSIYVDSVIRIFTFNRFGSGGFRKTSNVESPKIRTQNFIHVLSYFIFSSLAISYNRENYDGIKWKPETADIVINHWLNHLEHPDNVVGLKRVLFLLPGYPTFITRRVPGYLLQ